MSEIHDNTPALGLPLPHPGNPLSADVLRLRAALALIDELLQQGQEGQQALALALDQAVQALQQDTRQQVQQLAAAKVGSVNGQSGVAITLQREHLQLGPANGASSSALSYDADGRVTQITQLIDGHPCLQTIDYQVDGAVQRITTTFKGRTRTETFSYDNARISGSIATEEQTQEQP